jgi:hypothetical protein
MKASMAKAASIAIYKVSWNNAAALSLCFKNNEKANCWHRF